MSEQALQPANMLPSFRRLLPQLIIAGVLPVVGYTLLRPHVSSDAVALAAVLVFPAGETAFRRVREGRFEPIGLIAMVGISLGLLGALVFNGNAMLLKVRESAITGFFGVACLLSLVLPRPLMFTFGRAFAAEGDRDKMAAFDLLWEEGEARRRFRVVTAVWGVGLLAEAGLRTGLAFALPTQRFLEVSPPINWVILAALFVYTRFVIRSGEETLALSLAADVEDA